MRWLRRFAVLLGLLLAAVPGVATASAKGEEALSVCIRRDAPGLNAAALLAHPKGFDCRSPQTSFGDGDFWAIAPALPDLAKGHGVAVRFASLWQDAVTLYALHADGTISRTGFTAATAGQHMMLGATFSLSLPRGQAPPVRLLWHVRGAANTRGVVLGAALADHGANAAHEVMLAALYGGFAGMGIALIIYNLALWAALRQRFQPAYCLLIAMLLGYALTSSGAIGQWFPTLDNNDRQRMNVVLLAGSAMAALLFARNFFERAVFAGWLGRASTAVSAALGLAAIVAAAFAPWQPALLDRMLTAAYILLLALVPVILWRAWRVRSNYLWLFALAWGAPILLASLRIGNAVGLVEWSFWLNQSTIVSMAMEAVISSLAIAYRILLLSRERDRARAQEVAALILADTDPLTGLLNRRAFLRQAIGREGEQTLLVVDLDHFKRINETIGHDGGDEVLRSVARALRAAAPAEALVARIGGEEFAIVAPAAAEPSASGLLDRLRSVPVPFDVTVTASIGTCKGPLSRETDWKLLYQRADEALFAAKAAGRDRVRAAAPVALAA